MKNINIQRTLYTILYLVIGRFITMLLLVITLAQAIYIWMEGEPNREIFKFSKAMAEYSKQLVEYVSFNSNIRPWPIGEWPEI